MFRSRWSTRNEPKQIFRRVVNVPDRRVPRRSEEREVTVRRRRSNPER